MNEFCIDCKKKCRYAIGLVKVTDCNTKVIKNADTRL